MFDDVIAPPDLEQEIESQVEVTSTEDENIKALAEFPLDDIQVCCKIEIELEKN